MATAPQAIPSWIRSPAVSDQDACWQATSQIVRCRPSSFRLDARTPRLAFGQHMPHHHNQTSHHGHMAMPFTSRRALSSLFHRINAHKILRRPLLALLSLPRRCTEMVHSGPPCTADIFLRDSGCQ